MNFGKLAFVTPPTLLPFLECQKILETWKVGWRHNSTQDYPYAFEKDSSGKVNAEGASESIKSEQKSHLYIDIMRFSHKNLDKSGLDEGTSGTGRDLSSTKEHVQMKKICLGP